MASDEIPLTPSTSAVEINQSNAAEVDMMDTNINISGTPGSNFRDILLVSRHAVSSTYKATRTTPDSIGDSLMAGIV